MAAPGRLLKHRNAGYAGGSGGQALGDTGRGDAAERQNRNGDGARGFPHAVEALRRAVGGFRCGEEDRAKNGEIGGLPFRGAQLVERVRRDADHEAGGCDGAEGQWRNGVGGQMHAGMIRVRGRAGHLVGAAYRGSRRGMTGGTILVDGPAGNEIGHSMRRGLIAVGKADDAVGFGMIAGSILVFGPCGIRPGAGMRRGTIAILGHERPTLLPSFRHGCRVRALFLAMLLRELARLGYAVPESLIGADVDLYHGDFVALGRGEILFAASDR